MKFQKTIKFDLYVIGDRVMEDVIYFVDLEITDDNAIICTGAVPDIDCVGYIESLGGPGAVQHWEKQVLEHFDDEATCSEELGEAMTEEEYEQWEAVLMGEEVAQPATVQKSAFLDML
jgi:predicted RNA-binding protein